jgi:phosphatidylserine/phosphatidylglycerophosphate/cardiolipin synthase-like enzyme
MHLKGYCVDHRLLRTGSANFSRSGETRQDNDLVVLRGASVCAGFETKFDRAWARSRTKKIYSGMIAVNCNHDGFVHRASLRRPRAVNRKFRIRRCVDLWRGCPWDTPRFTLWTHFRVALAIIDLSLHTSKVLRRRPKDMPADRRVELRWGRATAISRGGRHRFVRSSDRAELERPKQAGRFSGFSG